MVGGGGYSVSVDAGCCMGLKLGLQQLSGPVCTPHYPYACSIECFHSIL
jgi:hypothetical protein